MQYFPQDLAEAIKRADCHQSFDPATVTLRIISLNTNAPLTEEEKRRIINHFTLRSFPLQIIFEEAKHERN